MGKKSKKIKDNNENQLNVKDEVDVKETLISFVSEEPIEQSQEQEILDFQLKKEKQKIKKMTEEELKKLQEKEKEEEEELKRIKKELLESLKVRIPAIEKRFITEDVKEKKGTAKENLKVKETELKENDSKSQQEKIQEDKEERDER